MFRNKYNEIRSVWGIVLAIALMLAGALAGSALTDLIFGLFGGVPKAPLTETQSFFYQAASSSSSILFVLLGFKLIYKRPLRQIGLYVQGWSLHLLLGGLLGIVLFGLATGLLVITGAARLEDFHLSSLGSLLFWLGFLKFILVGFIEEIACRGVMMTALKTSRNKILIVCFPAVLFGLLHLANPNITVFSVANIVLVGILFGYLFIKTGRLWVPIGFHITWNFVQGYIWGIPVSGGDVSSASLMRTVFTGPSIFTGGAFGVEGGAACTLILVLCLVFTHFFIKQNNNFWRMDSDLPLTRGENL